ncbi:MAG: hypothetical protein JSR61_18210 [Proteobacteria bacterium]|nr:hypothetical protein [Pseudomonadota bacterium]
MSDNGVVNRSKQVRFPSTGICKVPCLPYSGMGWHMEFLVKSLAEADAGLAIALGNLRIQQAIAMEAEGVEYVFRVLLSNSLRQFAYLEDLRNSIAEAIGEHLPMPRASHLVGDQGA